MKSCIFLLAAAVSTVFAVGTSRAEEKKPAEQGSLGKALVDRFDTNGNGQIDPDESAAARAQLGKGRGGKGEGRGKGQGLGGKGLGGKGLGGKGKGDGKMREALVKKFDANGNGQLEPAELEAAKAALEKMRSEKGKGKGKGNGDGARREAMLKKFDANGNGKLDADEMQAAKAELQKRRAEKTAKK